MALVADRFSVCEGGRAIDLATGEEITLLTTASGAGPDERKWLSRCDRFQQLWHHEFARLVDYGVLGESRRFEAWLCGAHSNGATPEAMRILESASLFLHGCGWTTGRISPECLRATPSGLVVLPPEDAGYDEPPAAEKAGPVPLSACGMAVVERRSAGALAEVFEIEGVSRPRATVLFGPAGSGKSAILCALARVARQHGFVPISAALVPRVFALSVDTGTIGAEVAGRSLFIIDDGAGCGFEAWLAAAIRGARPHVLVVAARREAGSFPGLRVDHLPADALAASIRPESVSAASMRRVHRAAVRAAGVPGRFVQLLWSDRGDVPWQLNSGFRQSISRAAERAAPYGRKGQGTPPLAPPIGSGLGADLGGTSGLGDAAEAAVRLLRAGRHASGERALRQEIGRLARRADYTKAGRSALALSASLLKRGQAQDARSEVETATDYLSRAADRDGLTDAATLAASTWVDLGRPGEGECAATAAIEAARASGDRARLARGSLALARALFWRGEYADADLTLGSVPLGSLHVDDAVRIEVMRSRVAVGLGDPSRALAVALGALERATAVKDHDLVGAARYGVAFVRLALGDLEAVERDTVACVAAARAAHDPLRAIRCRLLAGEAARRCDRLGVASSLVDRLRTLATRTVPPIVNARRELLSDLLKGGSMDEVVDRHVTATGLPALALLAGTREVRGGRTAVDPVAAELVEILQKCQVAEDEVTMLTDVCRRLRRQLHAVAVGFVSTRGGDCQVVATSGGRVHLEAAERTLAAGLPIAPHRSSERIESAAPVRYGGALVGSLVCRWPPGSSPDASRVPGVLAITAAAAAPALAALVDRNARPPTSNRGEFLGVSPAIQEIRRAVERAAAAPYPVLIEGESGCGKELVARAVHASGPRRDRAFCTVNCAALPDDLIEAELFGHARGAFTGAVAERPGLFEEANAGTLFLDEIGELSPRAQAKVLRVVQEGLLRRLGENVSRRVDVRLVSATNRNLKQEVAQGRFRTDLYYRLNVIAIVVPPLRDRREDIAPLIDHFWRQATDRVGSRTSLSTTTIAALSGYDWPGNVRELENVLAALAVRSPRHGVVSPAALPPHFDAHQGESGCRLDEARRTFEHHFVRAALVRAGGGRTRAAKALGVTRQGLSKLMVRLGIADEER